MTSNVTLSWFSLLFTLQGICSLHRLDNVSLFDVPSAESVVANNANASTVAFIAPNKNVLYVGVSYAGKCFD
jgi:plexin A